MEVIDCDALMDGEWVPPYGGRKTHSHQSLSVLQDASYAPLGGEWMPPMGVNIASTLIAPMPAQAIPSVGQLTLRIHAFVR